MKAKRNIYSVGQVNAYIKNMFDQDFMMNQIYVRGEASNVKYHSSGHIYFTLKDETGALSAVMFAGNKKKMSFKMNNGDNVIALGSIAVYERDGRYQLYAREILQDGAGLLYGRFLELKKELEEMGMFSEEYKQPIPKFIKKLGVVTAPTGAVIQDIQTISLKRNPYVQIVLCPAKVQGDGAAASIINGIHALEQVGVDVMIVGRGGGSMEDLWAFNEESVARAIFECQIPVISAVGHETDTTIADFVADLRAPTPSAAAQLAVYDVREVMNGLLSVRLKMNQLLIAQIEIYQTRLKNYQTKLKFLSPQSRLNDKKQLSVDLEQKLNSLMERKVERSRQQIALLAEKLSGLSPVTKLALGYSYVTDENGKVLLSVEQVEQDDMMNVHVLDGTITAAVRGKEKVERF